MDIGRCDRQPHACADAPRTQGPASALHTPFES
ncbi:hypothetical protein XaFJ1_GM002020 [Xanthomonas albilineans]|nr:hypothetical protein XaFJ1_GM002020 [Xanthomonas albilineans]